MSTKLKKSRGFALITALLLLVGLMLLGVSAVNMSVLDERLAGNVAHRNTTFQLAEAALRQAEEDVAKLASVDFTSLPQPWYVDRSQTGGSTSGWSKEINWQNARTITIPGAQSSQTVQYVIEDFKDMVIEPGNKVTYRYFRLSARAQDSTNNSSVIMQSISARPRDGVP